MTVMANTGDETRFFLVILTYFSYSSERLAGERGRQKTF